LELDKAGGVEESGHGQRGISIIFSARQMWIDCTTVNNPSFSRKMAVEGQAHGIRFLGCYGL
jgi:hypothetical protein